MKRNSILKNRLVGGMLAVGMILSSGAMAFANNDTVNVENTAKSAVVRQADGTKGAFKIGERLKDHKLNVEQKAERLEERLDELVDADVITQSEADDIIEYAKQMHEEREQERTEALEKIKDMTKEEAKEYIAGKKEERKSTERKGLFEQMIEDGKMSQDTLDSIKAYHQEKMEERIKENLQDLVDDGTLSDDDVDILIDYMKEHKDDRKEEMEQVKEMTPEERKAYFEEKRESGERTGIFEEMVEDEILTQEQADAVKKALKPAKSEKPGHKGFEKQRDGFKKGAMEHKPGLKR